MLQISLELVPASHLLFMAISWVSLVLYLRILYILNSRKNLEFKSSFFVIIKLHAITDIAMFLFVEFVARPRKYRIHNLIEPINNNWLPQLIYFTQTAIKNTMFLGYTVVAVNRHFSFGQSSVVGSTVSGRMY
ncbi:hypothetical protein L5515_009734 [Caenorhabditis briggsae]|uniref:Serpentine receptor class gamma n=1 Tax=Caenorhabditis briggsae TaxID=6238 RepID=A0AAE9F4V8_CAEBR|nr:hypothetical protein L5515_009734 [Caenorhabditis briggsae]